MIRGVLGSRASIGGVLGSGCGGGLYPWYLAGGVSAANCVAAYQPVGASSLAASYTNLATPGTYNAAPGVAPTFDTATGWTFDGTSQYLDTGVVPASGWSMIVRYSDASTSISDRYIIGSTNTNAQFAIQYRAFGSARRYRYGNATAESFNTATYGVIALVASNGYFNGVLDATGAGTFSGTGAGIFIALMRNGPATAYFAGKIQAVAIYNTTLTAPQVAALSSAMSAL